MRFILIILLFGCTTTKTTTVASRSLAEIPIPTIPTMNREELTAAHVRDSLRQDENDAKITFLYSLVKVVDSTQWMVSEDGRSIKLKPTQQIDSIFTTGQLWIGVKKTKESDTLIPIEPIMMSDAPINGRRMLVGSDTGHPLSIIGYSGMDMKSFYYNDSLGVCERIWDTASAEGYDKNGLYLISDTIKFTYLCRGGKDSIIIKK